MNQKLSIAFYTQKDVVKIAKSCIGKILVTNFDGIRTSGMITETEAYAGIVDKASHAYGGRRTSRTEIMYMKGGVAYVYFCYGMHSLFNIVTNQSEIPHAVLIRAIEPIDGIEVMLKRSNKLTLKKDFANGPGKVAKILGISCNHTGMDLISESIWLEDRGIKISANQIVSTPRIGVDYAGVDALLPYRFLIKKNKNN
jgi:DNA-3-methyladenine glycosylase